MDKFLIKVFVICVLNFGIIFADNTLVSGKEKITRNGVNIFLESNSLNKQKYLSGEFDKALEEMKKAYESRKDKKLTRASAPSVSEVQILEIKSTQGGYERVFGKTITEQDHGGDLFIVSTGVTGYGGGSNDRAKFAGNEAVQISSDGVDLIGDNIIDGWLDLWDISKPTNSSGMFEFSSRSINAPGNSMATSIQIR